MVQVYRAPILFIGVQPDRTTALLAGTMNCRLDEGSSCALSTTARRNIQILKSSFLCAKLNRVSVALLNVPYRFFPAVEGQKVFGFTVY